MARGENRAVPALCRRPVCGRMRLNRHNIGNIVTSDVVLNRTILQRRLEWGGMSEPVPCVDTVTAGYTGNGLAV
jgi:hypothetical protein